MLRERERQFFAFSAQIFKSSLDFAMVYVYSYTQNIRSGDKRRFSFHLLLLERILISFLFWFSFSTRDEMKSLSKLTFPSCFFYSSSIRLLSLSLSLSLFIPGGKRRRPTDGCIHSPATVGQNRAEPSEFSTGSLFYVWLGTTTTTTTRFFDLLD